MEWRSCAYIIYRVRSALLVNMLDSGWREREKSFTWEYISFDLIDKPKNRDIVIYNRDFPADIYSIKVKENAICRDERNQITWKICECCRGIAQENFQNPEPKENTQHHSFVSKKALKKKFESFTRRLPFWGPDIELT